MAKYKPIRIGDTVPLQQIATTEEVDARIYVAQSNVVLGRTSAGFGPHEEIPIGDLAGAHTHPLSDLQQSGATTGQVPKWNGSEWAPADDLAGGAGTVETKTYSEMQALISDGALTPGAWYIISDAAGTDLGFLTYAVAVGAASPVGIGGYMNADFQNVGVYSEVEGLTGVAPNNQMFIWSASNESGYSHGDIVIWNLSHYQITDSGILDGTAPDVSAAYQVLPRQNGMGYVIEWDISEFDFVNNNIIFRQDKRGNIVRMSSGILNFQWGKNNCAGNYIFGSVIDIKNISGFFRFNMAYSSAVILAIELPESSSIEYNILENGTNLTDITFGSGCSFSQNKIESGGVVSSIHCGSNCTMSSNIISTGAVLGTIALGHNSSMSNNNIRQAANLSSFSFGIFSTINNNILDPLASVNTMTGGDFTNISANKISGNAGATNMDFGDGESGFVGNTLAPGAQVSGITMGDGRQITSCEFLPGVEFKNKTLTGTVQKCRIGVSATETESISNEDSKTVFPGFSNFSADIDINGVTTLDLLAENNYVGVFTITSGNATESIDTISNAPSLFPFTIRPESGLALTITGTAYPPAAGQIALTTASVTLDGSKGEYIELEVVGGYLIERRRLSGIL